MIKALLLYNKHSSVNKTNDSKEMQMSKVKQSLLSLLNSLKNGLERFYCATFFSLTLFASCAYMINAEKMPDNITNTFTRIALTSLLGIFFSILVTLLKERYFSQRDKKLVNLVSTALSFLIPIIYGFFIFTKYKDAYQLASIYGYIIALVFLIIYFSNKNTNENFSEHWAHVFSKGFTAAIISLVLMLGLFLCTAAVNLLIYQFKDAYKIYLTISAFIWLVFFVQLYLSYFPLNKESYSNTAFFKKITVYAALPLFIVLVTILYIYLGKILITFKFPSGQINWFASCASLVGVFLYFGISQYSNTIKLVKYYIRFFGIAVLPIIAMQLWAYLIRFNSYGLTSTRYILLICIIVSILAAILAIIKSGKYLPNILLICAVLAIISTSGLLNLFDVSYFEQNSRLTSILQRNNMLDANKNITPNAAISLEEKKKITSAFEYLTKSGLKKSELLQAANKSDFERLFGFRQEHEDDDYSDYIYKYYNFESNKKQYNIEKYSQLIIINSENSNSTQFTVKDGVITISPDWPTGKNYIFDIGTKLQAQIKEGDKDFQVEKTDLIFETEDAALILDSVSIKHDFETNIYEANNFHGVFIIK